MTDRIREPKSGEVSSWSLLPWLWLNFKIGAFTFGSSGRIQLYLEDLVQKKKWLGEEEFFAAHTVAQAFPGANLVNLSAALSLRYFRSHFVAILGLLALCLPSTVLGFFLLGMVATDSAFFRDLLAGVFIGGMVLNLSFCSRLFLSVFGRDIRARLTTKKTLRYLLFLAALSASIVGWPLFPTLFLGIVLALTVEALCKP